MYLISKEKYLFGETGNPAKSSHLAFGALFIKQKLNITDEETVYQIQENPYLQYFIGFHEFSTEQPFTPSLMVSFRKRFTDDILNEINESSFIDERDDKQDHENSLNHSEDIESSCINKETLIIDATCAPSDIAYPTDLELLDIARIWCETIYDELYKKYGNRKKQRTYRNKARYEFLSINKRRIKAKQ